MSAPALQSSAPIVPVRDIEDSLAFYEGRLGFRRLYVASDKSSAEVARDGAQIMLVACDDAETLAVTATNMSVYVRVRDMAGLWADLAPRLSDLPSARLRPPFEQSYGMREFHVKDPDGFLLFFGEPLQ